MKLGLISDTHNDVQITKRAINTFRLKHVDLIIHAGDFTSPRMLALFKECKCKFVFGNSDVDINAINKEADKCGFGCIGDKCELNIGDKHILITHGHNVPVFRDAVSSGRYNYIIKGHTHFFEDYISNKTRIINPGSVKDADNPFVVILDITKDTVEKVYLDEVL